MRFWVELILAAGLALGLCSCGNGPLAIQSQIAKVGARHMAELNALVAASRPGDRLVLPSGRYKGSLVVNKNLFVEGRDTVLEMPDTGEPGLVITAPGAQVSGLRIIAAPGKTAQPTWGVIIQANGAVFRDSSLSGASLRVEDCQGVRLSQLGIKAFSGQAINRRLDGIRLNHGGGHILSDIRILDAADGIYFDHVAGARLSGVQVQGSRYGIHLMFSRDIEIRGATSRNNITGIMVMQQQGLVLEGSNFSRNQNSLGNGMVFYQSAGLRVSDNVVADNTTGIQLSELDDCLVFNNRIEGNGTGLNRIGPLRATHLSGNRFTGNLVALNDTTPDSSTDAWHRGQQGNNWDDYQGLDLNGNGIGDSPYRGGGVLAAAYREEPLLGLFFGSPLAQVFDGLNSLGNPVDPFPQMP